MADRVIIISGPSGVGKTTVIRLVAQKLNAKISISATTRPPGPQEQHGIDYYFLSRQEFESLIQQDELLEYAEYLGNYYGTPRDPIDRALKAGIPAILGIEVQGTKEVVKHFPDAIIIYLCPPSDEELTRRLRNRAREDEQTINRRLENAKNEMAQAKQAGIYKYWVVSDQVDRTVDEIATICKKEFYNDQTP